MRRLGIHKNIPVSGTKPMLGLQVGFINSHLTVDKLFKVNPRAITGPPKMSLLLEAKSMPALIIKPRLILVAHQDDLGWNKKQTVIKQTVISPLTRNSTKSCTHLMSPKRPTQLSYGVITQPLTTPAGGGNVAFPTQLGI